MALRLLLSKQGLAPVRRRWHPSISIGYKNEYRYFSDSTDYDKPSETDNERVADIYKGLFGDDDRERGTPSLSGAFEQYERMGERRSENRGTRQRASQEPSQQDQFDVADIPQRLWSDSLKITDERWMTKMEYDDIPDWSPDFVSRVSKDRVKIHPDRIPTLASLSRLPLPPPPFPHPGHGKTKEYAALRRKAHYEQVRGEVTKLAEPKIASILALQTWQEKQDAVDELFESIEIELRESESILSGHPKFGQWVEQALESHLKDVRKIAGKEEDHVESDGSAAHADIVHTENSEGSEAISYPSPETDQTSMPVFMDCYNPDDGEDEMVPRILHPLRPHPRDGPGRMVEEWELSAHTKTKRIMLRQSTREMARVLVESPRSRILVSGRRGVGKTAAIASIVASARQSGYIVLYLPDGNRLHKLGYYIVPNPNQKLNGMFDLPILSQDACAELLLVHEKELEGMEASQEIMEHFFTASLLEELPDYSGGSVSLVHLLKAAKSSLSCAPMCYSVAVHCLSTQEDKPFLIALDEFNCYFEPGHYFHMDYDDDVKNAIPYDRINLFKPALDAMALSTEEDEDIPLLAPRAPKRGGVVAGISESCAIARKVTDNLVAYAHRSATDGRFDTPLHIFEVPRFSEIEVDHVLANFEAIGIGNLRCDRGETVMNKDGVAYLRLVSQNTGQNLLDYCCF